MYRYNRLKTLSKSSFSRTLRNVYFNPVLPYTINVQTTLSETTYFIKYKEMLAFKVSQGEKTKVSQLRQIK